MYKHWQHKASHKQITNALEMLRLMSGIELQDQTRKESFIMEENFDLSVPSTAKDVDKAITGEQQVVVRNDDNDNLIVDLTSRTVSYCSFVPTTQKEKAQLYNATNNTSKRVKDLVNTEINLRNVYVEVVNCTDSITGEVIKCPRIVLIDDENTGYVCVSVGIFSALKKLFTIFGEPSTWEEPVRIRFRQVSTSNNKSVLTFDTVIE